MKWHKALACGCMLLMGAAMVSAQADFDRVWTKTVEVQATPDLEILSLWGGVTLKVADVPNITIKIHQQIQAKDEKQANGIFDCLQTQLTVSPDKVKCVSSLNKSIIWDWDLVQKMVLETEVTVPSRLGQCRIRTTAGQITLPAMAANVDMETDFGGIFSERIEGDISARTESGRIYLTGCSGDAKVKTISGDILVGKVEGSANLESSGGVIEAQQVLGALTIVGNSSDITATVGNPLKAPVKLRTSGGDIYLKIERNVKARLDLRASIFGGIKVIGLDALQYVNGKPGDSRIEGLLNQGGETITAHASGGNIHLKGLEPLNP